MSNLIYKSTGVAIRFLTKVLKLKFTVLGKENLCDGPTLYVVNHFTRFETLFLPSILYKTTGKQLKTLAKESLFKGSLGKVLNSLGVVSRKDPNRNKAIISDLMTGASNWVIYPEGMMVKNKLTIDETGNINLKTPYYNGLPKTGAAVMALKAEAIKQTVWKNMRERKLSAARKLLKRYDLKVSELSRKPLRVIPTNITYYPMHLKSKQTLKVLQKLANKKTLPKMVQQELSVEAALLGNSEIMVSFAPAENLAELVRKSLFNVSRTPLLGQQAMIDFITGRHRFHLTKNFMKKIYHNVYINIDHLLTLLFFKLPRNFITHEEVKFYLFSAITFLFSHNKNFNLQPMLVKTSNVVSLLASAENFKNPLLAAMKKFLEYAKINGYVRIENRPIRKLSRKNKLKIESAIQKKTNKQKVYIINKNKVEQEEEFINIRIKNPLRVIYNEFSPMFSLIKPLISALQSDKLSPLTKKNLELNYTKIACEFAEKKYYIEREKYIQHANLKPSSIGKPMLLTYASEEIGNAGHNKFKKNSCGIILSHGYKAAPYEVKSLGKYLQNQGNEVFIPRLSGHGTCAESMEKVSRKDWLNDYLLAAHAMAKKYKKVFLIGFSAGGLLALTTAAKEKKINFSGVVTISTPFVLKNIFFKLPGYIEKWNKACTVVGLNALAYKFISERVEHANTNYRKNYLHGIAELDKLIVETKKLLKNVKNPLLCIQGSDDPVVSSESANVIVTSVSSKSKSVVFLERNNHVIVRGFGSSEVFERVDAFIKKFS